MSLRFIPIHCDWSQAFGVSTIFNCFYYLPDIVIFARFFDSAFLLNEVTKKMQATEPTKENGNIIPSSVKN
jgi:hypothetical protein